MNLAVILEHRFLGTPDGAIWTSTTFAYPFWRRYLEVFDSVRVVARVLDVPEAMNGWKRADGESVTFAPVPYYVGPQQFLLRCGKVIQAMRRAVALEDAVILRVPSLLANWLAPYLSRRGQPFGLEVVGDPWDVFSPGAAKYAWPVRVFARWWFTQELRKQCEAAAGLAYVTQSSLQRRYPPAKRAYCARLSDVELPGLAFASDLWTGKRERGGSSLITVGMLEQLYKGVDVLIDAIAHCVKGGLDVRLTVVGDGRHRGALEARCVRQGIEQRVRFLGQLPAGEPVRAQLDRADLFVLASRVEGLPRAMIEAMARGLPCIGTTVGGIPELLPPEDMVPPNDAWALAAKIAAVLNDPERMVQMSRRNYQKALEYREELLREKRLAFYRRVREITEEWHQSQAA